MTVSGAIETFDAVLPHGITLSCRAAGSGGPRVMLLHGFPEGAFVWDEVMLALARHARCIAPNQRGYERSSAPADVKAYRSKHLVADVAALIAQFGAPLDVLVAHDWGGAVAWNLAALHPQLMRHLVIVNSPHPAALLRELRASPGQQAASAYMNELVQPDAAERLSRDDFADLWSRLSGWGDASWLTDAVRQQYREVWSHGLAGALNWYRASPLRPPLSDNDPVMTLQLPSEIVNVHVPTTVIWGEADRALLPGLLDGLDSWVSDLRVVRVNDASHWIVHEKPQLVVDAIQQALKRNGT